jgi:hypothetical protein
VAASATSAPEAGGALLVGSGAGEVASGVWGAGARGGGAGPGGGGRPRLLGSGDGGYVLQVADGPGVGAAAGEGPVVQLKAARLRRHLVDDLAARLLARGYLALGQLALLRVYRLGGGVALLVLEHELEQAGDRDGPLRAVLEGDVGGEEAVVGILYGPVEVRVRQDAHLVQGGLDTLDLDGVAHVELLLGRGLGCFGALGFLLLGRFPALRGRRFVGGGLRDSRVAAAYEGEAHNGADAYQDEQDGG